MSYEDDKAAEAVCCHLSVSAPSPPTVPLLTYLTITELILLPSS